MPEPLRYNDMSIAVFGTLRHDARYGVRGVNDAVVTLSIQVTERGAGFEAHVAFGSAPDRHLLAQSVAAQLRKGQPARLDCRELAWCNDHGDARFVARGLIEAAVAGRSVVPA